MKIPRLRWLMISLIFLATVINYIDRQTVSVLKTAISADLGLSNADYAAIQNSFLVLYGISQMVSGRLYDRIGTRLGFIFSIVVWSGAAIAHAFARTAGQFRLCRGVLGFGEAGNWPGAAKAGRRVVPGERARPRDGHLQHGRRARRRRVAAHHRVAGASRTAGARRSSSPGCSGSCWLALWARALPRARAAPVDHRGGARATSSSDRAGQRRRSRRDWRPGWLTLLTYRQTWAVVVGRFITDPIWWLYIFWLPSYFQEARGFSLQQIGWSAWLPFLCAGIGALGGGWASGFLIQRGWTRGPRAQDGDGRRRAAHAGRHPRHAGREPLHGAAADGRRAVRLPGVDQQPADAAERLLPEVGRGVGLRPRRHVRGHRERPLQLGHGPRGRRDGLHAGVRRRRACSARSGWWRRCCWPGASRRSSQPTCARRPRLFAYSGRSPTLQMTTVMSSAGGEPLKCANGLVETLHDACSRLPPVCMDDAQRPRAAERFVERRSALDDAVGEEREDVAVFERRRRDGLEPGVSENTERHPGAQQFARDGARSAQDVARRMAGARVVKLTSADVQAGQQQRDEPVVGNAPARRRLTCPSARPGSQLVSTAERTYACVCAMTSAASTP